MSVLDDDIGYQETEAELARLESELQQLYGTASTEMQQKALDYMGALLDADEKMRRQVINGVITPDEWQRWRTVHLATAERYRAMADVLSFDLLQINQIAARIINRHMPSVYAINMNYMTYLIEKATRVDTSFTLYNHDTVARLVRDNPDLLPIAQVDIAKDTRWSKQHINSAVTQGILQGEPIPDIAARLRMVSDMDMRASIRNARTMTTSAQNGGRMDSMRRAQSLGAKIKKMWVATLDSRTRHWHRQMDGQVRDMDKPFESDIGKIMFPGDPAAHPANVYNCRCAVVTEDLEFPIDASDLSLRYDKNLNGMSYAEWKDARKPKKPPVNPDNPSYGYPEVTE